jgi:hypothetical protein
MRVKVKTKIRAFLLMAVALCSVQLFGQEQKATIFDESTIIYKQMLYGGGTLHSLGYGVHFTYGRNKTAFKSRIYTFDIVTMKHPKEVRSYYPLSDESRSYVYGKLNYMLVIRPTIGVRNVKFDKIRPSGVAVGYTWRLGPSLAFTRPVYLEIIRSDVNSQFQTIVVEKYDPLVHDANVIYGRAGILRGVNETRIHPGVHGVLALNFEYDPRRDGIKGLEVGAAVDFYPMGDVEIMAFAENLQTYLTFYVTFQLGARFNK